MLFINRTCENCTELHYISEATFQCSLHLCRQSSSTLQQEQVFLPHSSCTPSPAATDAWHSAVPHQWHYGVLALLLSRNSTGDNLIVQGQDCRVDAATLSIQYLWWPLWFTHLCTAWNFYAEATLLTLFSWDKIDQDKHSDFLAFQYEIYSSLTPSWPRI